MAAIHKAIEQWRKVSIRTWRTLRPPLRRRVILKQMLLAPLEEHLAGVKTLLVSPDGAVSGIPWAALPGKEARPCLLEDLAIGVIAVPRLLGELVAPSAAGVAPIGRCCWWAKLISMRFQGTRT